MTLAIRTIVGKRIKGINKRLRISSEDKTRSDKPIIKEIAKKMMKKQIMIDAFATLTCPSSAHGS